MLTKTLVLPTDRFTFLGGNPPELARPGRTGEGRVFSGGDGVRSFLGGETGRAGTGGLGIGGEVDVVDWDFPPSRKPLPLKGMMFLIS